MRLGILENVWFESIRVSGFKIAGKHYEYTNRYFGLNGGFSPEDGEGVLRKLDEVLNQVRDLRYRGLEVAIYWAGNVYGSKAEGCAKMRYYGTPGIKNSGHLEIDLLAIEGNSTETLLGDVIAKIVKENEGFAKEIARVFEYLLKGYHAGPDISDIREYLDYARVRKIVIAYDDSPMTRISSRYGMALLSTESIPREIYESLQAMLEKVREHKEVFDVYRIMDVVKISRLGPVLYESSDRLVRISRECGVKYASAGSFIVINDEPLTKLVEGITEYYYEKLKYLGIVDKILDVWKSIRGASLSSS